MSKFFLIGHHYNNAGPCNVNRSLISNCDNNMAYIVSRNKYFKIIEIIWKLLIYKKILVSGIPTRIEFLILTILKTKYYYLMHGCARYENKINQLGLSEDSLKIEDDLLEKAIKIIAVSERYAQWVKKQYPQYANKITYANNGIDLHPVERKTKRDEKHPILIAVSGGNRPIKRNFEVCKAVEKLNKRGWNIRVLCFGGHYPSGQNIEEFPFVKMFGQLDKEEYYHLLLSVDLYIINSIMESFGLVVADAINNGCSLLVSKVVGALCIFNQQELKEEDIIQDTQNIDEISDKIITLIESPNATRLRNLIKAEFYNKHNAYQHLKHILNKPLNTQK